MGRLQRLTAGPHPPRMAPQSAGSPSAPHEPATKKEFDPLGNRPPRVKDLPKEEPNRSRLLSSTARGVFGVLCEHANRNEVMWPEYVPRGQAGWLAWPSVLTLSAMTGYTDRAVQEALAELESKGAIQCIYRSKGGAPRKINGKWGSAKTNCYLITPNVLRGSTRGDHSAETQIEPRTSRRRTVNLVHPMFLITELKKTELAFGRFLALQQSP